MWNEVFERTKRRLAGWKKLYPSKGGIVTLEDFLICQPMFFLFFMAVCMLIEGSYNEDSRR